jgi:hypothetical protein
MRHDFRQKDRKKHGAGDLEMGISPRKPWETKFSLCQSLTSKPPRNRIFEF